MGSSPGKTMASRPDLCRAATVSKSLPWASRRNSKRQGRLILRFSWKTRQWQSSKTSTKWVFTWGGSRRRKRRSCRRTTLGEDDHTGIKTRERFRSYALVAVDLVIVFSIAELTNTWWTWAYLPTRMTSWAVFHLAGSSLHMGASEPSPRTTCGST